MLLLDLPVEILVAIVAQVMAKKDLKHLCEVSKILYALSIPILYESVTVAAKEEEFLEDLDVELLLRTRDKPINHLQHVKALQITSKFHARLKERCIHHRLGYRLDEDEAYQDWDESFNFAGQIKSLMPLLTGCKDNSLRSFSWELGTCVPHKILGPLGYLPLKQTGLESIRLVTDGACDRIFESPCPLALSAFPSLKRLSWSGFSSDNDFKALHETLQKTSAQLVELELDLVNSLREILPSHIDDVEEDLFVRTILELSHGGTEQMFPRLEVLSLSAVSFTPAEKKIAHVFNSSTLRSLKLHCCSGWGLFLRHASHANRHMKLKSLEIQDDHRLDSESDLVHAIPDFLRSFEGLEELFISISWPNETLDLWRSAAVHKSTLKRFVHHQRFTDDDLGWATLFNELDSDDLSFSRESIAELMRSPSQNPLSDLDLKCIGLCCAPKFLKAILFPFTTKCSLQVLHIRQSGSDLKVRASWGSFSFGSKDPTVTDELYHFAQWAFGPNGITSLRVIAFGDFSYEERYAGNLLLCRNSEPTQTRQQGAWGFNFQYVKEDNQSLWEFLDRYSNVLEACPTDPILMG